MSAKTGTGKYEKLLERCKSLEAIPTAVAHPCEESALAGAVEAAQAGLIEPILVGLPPRLSRRLSLQTSISANSKLSTLNTVSTQRRKLSS